MSQGVESEAGEPGGEREYRDQTAASTPGHPNSSETASSNRGVTRSLSNRWPPPTTNDTKRQNANAIMIFVGGRGTKHAMLGAKIMAYG